MNKDGEVGGMEEIMEGKVPFLSVIVPIYNVGEYIDLCIESISKQTFKDMEIILVDDGSTDLSGNICDQWKEKDGRIRVIHKQNEGVVKARKEGTRLANGRYITFVDGDDWIDDDLYQAVVPLLNKYNADVICYGITVQKKDGGNYIEECLVDKGLYETKREKETLYRNMFCCDNGFSQKNFSYIIF